MRSNQARFLFRIFAAPVAVVAWLAGLLLMIQAMARGDFRDAAMSVPACLNGSPWSKERSPRTECDAA
jgi:hypothetical protein